MTAKNRELAGRERRKIFQMIADSMRLPKPLWRALAVALAGMFFLLVWDAVGALFIARHAPAMLGNELLLYITIKAGFVIVIAALITTSRSWRRLGYLGGAGSRFWTLMFPAWVSAALSLSGGIGDLSALRCAGWLGLGVVIAVGEETIFRGVALAAFMGHGPRGAIIMSSLLFGAAHLVGIGSGIDIHMVLAQVVFATGLGLCFAWVRIASGSIWPCVIAHALMDGAGLASANGVASALRYESDSYPLALASAMGSLVWGIFLLCRPLPDDLSHDAAAAMPAASAVPQEDHARSFDPGD